MGTARIVGHWVRVERKETSTGAIYILSDVNPDDGLYQAARLHAHCEQTMLAVSPFSGNSFYITEATIDDEITQGTLNREYICTAIKDAAQVGVSAAR
jgi:hypothetical protein